MPCSLAIQTDPSCHSISEIASKSKCPDDHVTDEEPAVGEYLVHRKGQHVRGLVLCPVLSVEFLNLLVTDQGDAQLRTRFFHDRENALRGGF